MSRTEKPGMYPLRWLAMWIGCALLTAGFVAAEELAGSAARRGVPQPTAEAVRDEEPARPVAASTEHALPPDADGSAAGESLAVADVRSKPLYRICRVTAYCDRGVTAAGVPSGPGQCAAPADIPLGSQVYIPALDRTFIVTDRTHRRFRHNTVDLFIPSRKVCRKFGRRYLECEFTIAEEPPTYGKARVAR